MTTVQLISDPQATQAFLWPHIQRAWPSIRCITRLDLRSLGSVQAGRGVIRITVHTQTANPKFKTLNLFANYDARGGSKTIYQFLKFLRQHGFGRGTYGAPQALCYSAKYKLLIYQSFPGRRIRDELEAGKLSAAGLSAVMQQSAVWLKKFHRLPPRVGAPRNLRLAPAFFSKLTTGHRRVISAALPLINKELARHDHRSLVHGDPHLANCIRGAHQSFAFIDFSESYVGSAAADIAMYLVHLDVALQPFFSRRAIAKAQRIFIEKYYGRSVDRLPPQTRRSLLAFELRTAALFLRFTSDHHRHPSSQVAWMIQHFVNVVSRGTDQLQSNDPQLILAA